MRLIRRIAASASILAAAVAAVPATTGGAVADERKSPPGVGAPAPVVPTVTALDPKRALGVLGRAVRDAAGDDMGHIIDVVVDPTGHVLAAVIDFGGFLGVGSRKIAVDWEALRFGQAVKNGADIQLELTRDQLKAAPEYNPEKPLVVIGTSGTLRPLDFP